MPRRKSFSRQSRRSWRSKTTEHASRFETAPGMKRRYRGSLTLTAAGRAQALEMREIVAEKLNAVSGGLDPDKLSVFYEVFHRIDDKLDGI